MQLDQLRPDDTDQKRETDPKYIGSVVAGEHDDLD